MIERINVIKIYPLKVLCSLLEWLTKETLIYKTDLINSKERSMVKKKPEYINFSFSKLFDVCYYILQECYVVLC